jgi:MYXO-CTERM domain-containing protein
MPRRLASALIACLTVAPSVAAAHTLMTSPTPRSDSDGLKTGPCGNVAATDAPNELMAGSTITVRWLETVDHPGYYRIAYSMPGDADFEDHVLLDQIADVDCPDEPCSYTAEVTLPSEPCEGCALQLIQYMGTAAPYSPYFSCTDVTLMAAPGPVEGDAGVGDPDPGTSPGGVTGSCSSGSGGSAGLAIFLAMALVTRRRRAG